MDLLGDSVNVAASVATVIAAFRDADSLVQKLKMRLAAIPRARLPPAELEDTVFEAPEEIERTMRRCVERLPQFSLGDEKAVINIQQITIVLRSGLIEKLRSAVDGGEPNFQELIDMAESHRDSTLSALFALRQRLMQSARTSDGLSPPVSFTLPTIPAPLQIRRAEATPTQVMPVQTFQHDVVPTPVLPNPSVRRQSSPTRSMMSIERRAFFRKSPMPPPMDFKDFVGTAHLYSNQQETSNEEPSVEKLNLNHKYRPSEVLGVLKRLPTRVYSNDESQTNRSRFRNSFVSSKRSGSNDLRNSRQSLDVIAPALPFKANDVASPVSPFNEQPTSIHPALREADRAQFEIWAPDPISEDSQRNTNSDTLSVISEEASRAPSMLSSPASTSTMNTATSNLTNSTRPTQFSSISRVLATPAPENDYLGFCKGAVRVQNEERRGMTERRDFTQSAQSDVSYPSCKHCGFKGHLFNKVIWDKVVNDEDRGIKYRWTFLAKSHVKQKSVKEQNYAYQCLFCVYMGQREAVIYSQNAYLDHINKEHRGINLDDVILYRTRCINNRICRNNEKFDINLFPHMKAAASTGYDADFVKEVQVSPVPVEMLA